jgi:hypothetical protein
MTGLPDPESGIRFTDEEAAWLAEKLPDMRRGVAERRFRYQILWSGLAIGLVVHVVGYVLKSSVTGEPIGVLTDLLYTFGFALWTGVVVVTLVDIIPAAKERQISRWLDAYEAAQDSPARSMGDVRASGEARASRKARASRAAPASGVTSRRQVERRQG